MNKENEINNWKPTSWTTLNAAQQANYPNEEHLASVVAELKKLPPIVTSWEVDKLNEHIAAAQRGEVFILQGGDCAESFSDCSSESIVAKLKLLLQMSTVMQYGLKKPVVRIGRMAGQYAKPRSADLESKDGQELPSYRGDIINRSPFTSGDRIPDPTLILRGYERAALTMNFVRSLIDGGFVDLHHPEYWDLDWLGHSEMADRYNEIITTIKESIDFIESTSGRPLFLSQKAEIYAAHEGLHLPYEQAQTRYIERTGNWYNLTTHFPWIGMRTAELDGAHVEYFRGVANPMGIKIGNGMTREWLQGLIVALNPNNLPGRITLIHRFGADSIEANLPPLVEAANETGSPILWVCDPMHGNTESTADGTKTRRFEKISAELESAFRVHKKMGTYLGGVHLELTGENVTECTGGARGLNDADLSIAYKSPVDPRLNYEQAMEIALGIPSLQKRAIID